MAATRLRELVIKEYHPGCYLGIRVDDGDKPVSCGSNRIIFGPVQYDRKTDEFVFERCLRVDVWSDKVVKVGTPLRMKIDDNTAEAVFTGQFLIHRLGGDERVARLLDQLGQVYSKGKAAEFSRMQTAVAREEARNKKRKPRSSWDIRGGLEKVAEGASTVGLAVGIVVSAAIMAPATATVLNENDGDNQGYGAAKTHVETATVSFVSAALAGAAVFGKNGIPNVYTEGWFALSAASTLVGFGAASFYAIRKAAQNFSAKRRRELRLERIRQAFCSSEELGV